MTEFFSRFGTRAGGTNTLRYLCYALAIVLSMVLLLGQPTSAFAQGDLAPDVRSFLKTFESLPDRIYPSRVQTALESI